MNVDEKSGLERTISNVDEKRGLFWDGESSCELSVFFLPEKSGIERAMKSTKLKLLREGSRRNSGIDH
jgi:hypothetical protein